MKGKLGSMASNGMMFILSGWKSLNFLKSYWLRMERWMYMYP